MSLKPIKPRTTNTLLPTQIGRGRPGSIHVAPVPDDGSGVRHIPAVLPDQSGVRENTERLIRYRFRAPRLLASLRPTYTVRVYVERRGDGRWYVVRHVRLADGTDAFQDTGPHLTEEAARAAIRR